MHCPSHPLRGVSPPISEGAGGHCGAVPAVPPRAVLQSRAPGLACGEQQGLGGIKGTRGCSCLLLFSMTFERSLKAEHRAKWTQLLLASHDI